MANKSTLDEYFRLLNNLIKESIPFVIDLEIKGKGGIKRTFKKKKVKIHENSCLLIEEGYNRNGAVRYISLDARTRITRFALYL